jgi:hypothetical protein
MPNLNDLPEFGEQYIQYFDPYLQSFEIRRKSRADGNLSLSECIEYINLYMTKHQMTYIPNKSAKNLILFPFMFNEPVVGDKILNSNTKEVYTVQQIIRNPETNVWEGLVKFNLINPPSIEESHSLMFLGEKEKYIRFRHEMPDEIPNLVGANLEKLLVQPPPIFPTITWTVKSVEPGSLGRVFDSKKEYKPRLRESVKDPLVMGHTVQIFGQFFDNIVQFDSWSNDPRTSDRLIRWFEQFLRLRMGNLVQHGLSHGMFLKRSEDGYDKTWRQAFSVRGAQYYFRTEQIDAIYSKDILNIDVTVGVESTAPSNRKFNSPRWIADQMVSGELTDREYKDLFYRSGEYLFGNIEFRQ